MSYKLNKRFEGYITRLSDEAVIPPDPDNRDYQEYLAWVARGNTPAPAYTPEELAEKAKVEEEMAKEVLITEKIREMAVAELKKVGKLPGDFKAVRP